MDKVRAVIDYDKLSPELSNLFEETYPNGLLGNIIRFPNAKNEIVTAARIETEDRIYLVKINAQPKETFNTDAIDDFIDNYGKGDTSADPLEDHAHGSSDDELESA